MPIGNGFPCTNPYDDRPDCLTAPSCSDANVCPVLHPETQSNPFLVVIQPAAYSAVDCMAYGPGVSQATAGLQAFFTIQPKDIYGNNGTYNPLQTFLVGAQSIENPGLTIDDPRVVAPTQNSPTAQYIVDYTITVAGLYDLDIKLSNTKIMGGQVVTFEVVPGVAFAGTSTVDDTVDITRLAQDIPAGSQAEFVVTSYDQFGNLRAAGGDTITAELRALSGDSVNSQLITVSSTVTDLLSGSYNVRFSANISNTCGAPIAAHAANMDYHAMAWP